MFYTIDMTGRVVGRLTVIRRAPNDRENKARWRCRCSCGKEKIVSGNHLRKGRVKSCGCLAADLASDRELVHGHSIRGAITTEYIAFRNMRDRARQYALPLQKEWETQEGFIDFFNYIGARPIAKAKLVLMERKKGYVKGNIRWNVHS